MPSFLFYSDSLQRVYGSKLIIKTATLLPHAYLLINNYYWYYYYYYFKYCYY